MADKTRASEISWLLAELCAEMGCCLPETAREELARTPPLDVDAFTEAVFAAEGLDARLDKQLRRDVRDKVDRRIGGWLRADQ